MDIKTAEDKLTLLEEMEKLLISYQALITEISAALFMADQNNLAAEEMIQTLRQTVMNQNETIIMLQDTNAQIETEQKVQMLLLENAKLKERIAKLYESDLELQKAEELHTAASQLMDIIFSNIKLNVDCLSYYFADVMPQLCVIDPLQAFLPDGINISSRADMRNALSPLLTLAQNYGTTFLIIVHTNKRFGASGRNRLADSADIWDIARSVLMVGVESDGEKSIHYLSHEKSNYGPLQQTILFDIVNGTLTPTGVSDKRDRDFVYDQLRGKRNADEKHSDLTTWLLEHLGNTEHILGDIKDDAIACGFSENAFNKAKRELVDTKKLYVRRIGHGKSNGTTYLIGKAGCNPISPEDL